TPVGIIYGVATHWNEPTGIAGLLLCAGLNVLIGGYLFQTSRRIDERPEDDKNARIEDGDSEVGFFSPWSWWPILIGAAAGLIFLGFAVAYWIAIVGVGFG